MPDLWSAARVAKRTASAGVDYVKRGNEATWRYGFNWAPTRDYARRPPQLGDEARRVLADVERDGVATSTLGALIGDSSVLAQLQELSADLEAAKADVLARVLDAPEEGLPAARVRPASPGQLVWFVDAAAAARLAFPRAEFKL